MANKFQKINFDWLNLEILKVENNYSKIGIHSWNSMAMLKHFLIVKVDFGLCFIPTTPLIDVILGK